MVQLPTQLLQQLADIEIGFTPEAPENIATEGSEPDNALALESEDNRQLAWAFADMTEHSYEELWIFADPDRNRHVNGWSAAYPDCIFNPLSLTDLGVAHRQAYAVSGEMGSSGAPHAVLVFRGTDELLDVATDINMALIQDTAYGEGFIHAGFRNAANDLWPNVEGYINSQLALRTDEQIATGAPLTLDIAGHSLGGAIATLIAARVHEQYGDQVEILHLATYGSPRVGDFIFSSTLTHHSDIGEIWRITNDNDPIPHFPTRLQGFDHIGEGEYRVNEFGVLTYLTALPNDRLPPPEEEYDFSCDVEACIFPLPQGWESDRQVNPNQPFHNFISDHHAVNYEDNLLDAIPLTENSFIENVLTGEAGNSRIGRSTPTVSPLSTPDASPSGQNEQTP